MKARLTFTLLFTLAGVVFSATILSVLSLIFSLSFSISDVLLKIFSNSSRSPSNLLTTSGSVGLLGTFFIIVFMAVVSITALYGYRYGGRVGRSKGYKREHLNLLLTVSIFSLFFLFTLGYSFINPDLEVEERECVKISDLKFIKGSKIVNIEDRVEDEDQDGVPDRLKIDFFIESACAGVFFLNGELYSKTGNFLRNLKLTKNLEAGQGEITFNLSLSDLPDILSPGVLSLKKISLSGSYLSPLTRRVEEIVVDEHQGEFLFGHIGIELTSDLLKINRIADYGVDLNGNGLFEELVLEIEGMFLADGEFGVVVNLDNGLSIQERSVTFKRGVGRLVLSIDGTTIYKRELTGPYSVKEARFQLKSNPDINFVAGSLVGYRTKEYGYKQFE